MRMAAIYARVSSEQQREENTIASQTASLIEFAKSHELEVPKEWVFEDEGYSGATLERPGLERVRDLAAEGQIQVALAYSPDRLSRKYAYQILLIEEFARQGVETLFVKSPQGNSPEDHLLVQFQGMIAEYERAQILERSRRGKRHRAHAGEVSVMSGAPYGYRYIRKTDEALAAYIVDEVEASVVRRVYDMYTVEGLSIAEITRRLNREGIPTRKASRWERSVVWGMLRNPAYRGVACFGKTRLSARAQMRPQRRRGITTPRNTAGHQRPREEWIEIPVPALVTEETFARAQELLYQNKIRSRRRTVAPSVVQGLVACAKCGYAFSRTSTQTSARKIHYYKCIGSDSWRKLGGPVCGNNRFIRQELLDQIVLCDSGESGDCMHPVPSPPTLAFVSSVQTRHSRVFPQIRFPWGAHFGASLPFACATTCRFVHPPVGSDRIRIPPTRIFTAGLSTVWSPAPPPAIATVATGQFPPAGLAPARMAASIAAH